MVDDSAKQAVENEDAAKEEFDPSLPPELRKIMEQNRQREEAAAAAAAAAAAQAAKEETMMDRAGTQGPGDEIQPGKSLTQTSLNRKKSLRDEKLFNGKFDF